MFIRAMILQGHCKNIHTYVRVYVGVQEKRVGQEKAMAQQHARSRNVGSSRARSARITLAPQKSLGSGDLREMSRNTNSVEEFAAETSLRTKSEVGVDETVRQLKKDGRKQAWAPSTGQSLTSSSARFQGRTYHTLPPHPNSHLRKDGSSQISTKESRSEVHLQQLEKLRKIFDDARKRGDGKLDEGEFLKACGTVFGKEAMTIKGEEELRTIFKKTDTLSNDLISWDDFCTFLYLEFQEKDIANARDKKVDFHIPALMTTVSPHHDSVCAIQHLNDGALVTCSEGGTVCFWSQDLELKRTKPPLTVNMDMREKPKWISDMVLSLPHKKIILATGDCELQFYEMVNFEPYCQISKLECIPLKIVCWHDPDDEMNTVLLLGDKDGTVTVMTTENILDAFKYWKIGPKVQGFPTYSLHKLLSSDESKVKCYRWQLHSSWVTELHYFPKLMMFASSSLDPSASLVMGYLTPSTEVDTFLRQMSVRSGNKRSLLPAKRLASNDQRVFRVTKGISSVDYCPKHNVLVTASADRFITVWNPFLTSKPIGILRGHTAPIFYVKADSANSRLFSIGNDNTIKVWDTVEFTCLNTVIPYAHKFTSPTQAAHYSDVGQQIVLATDKVCVVQLVKPEGVKGDMVQTHRSPLAGIAFSPCFNHLITACTDGVVKVWAIESGKKEFEFAVGTGCGGISSLAIDSTGKRVVTGCLDGRLRVWSYNSGECLGILDKGNTMEVSSARYVSVNQCKYVVTAGWDQKVTLFHDVVDEIQNVHKPMDVWSTASEDVHQSDILALAYGSPYFMATADFHGKVAVWSLVSFCILNELKADYPSSTGTPPSMMEGDEAVQDLVFLDQRTKSKRSANLIASGPAGFIHFWNIFSPSKPLTRFQASNFNCVTSLAVDQKNILLISGDIEGFLSLWRIEHYCMNSRGETSPPDCIAKWRAHTQKITQLLLIEQWNVIISASTDTSVRLWTFEGHFISTFGQEMMWSLGKSASYKHPLISRDLLIHTTETSCVTTPPFTRRNYSSSISSSATKETEIEKPKPSRLKSAIHAVQATMTLKNIEDELDDDTSMLQQYGISLNVRSEQAKESVHRGKWMRHHQTQSAKPTKITSHQRVYRLLPYQTLSDSDSENLLLEHDFSSLLTN